MKFQEILYPISKELNLVDQELIGIDKNTKTDSLQEILDFSFKGWCKELRPTTLTLISAKIVNDKLSEPRERQLMHLAAFLELAHSKSLIHDNVIDDDIIHSQKFSNICNLFPKEFTNVIAQLIETMCAAEIEQANECTPTKDKDYKGIEGKTVFFMAICCELGAVLAGGDNNKIISLESYGYNLGIAYQILDDFMNDANDADLKITLKDARNFADNAIASIDAFENSPYKQSLIDLVNFILNTSYEKVINT